MKKVSVVNYGTEYKVFVSYDGKEVLRVDGLKYEEANQLGDYLEIGQVTILEGANAKDLQCG